MNKTGIYKLDQFGIMIAHYETSTKAAKENNISQPVVSRCANTISEAIAKNKSIVVRSKDVYVKAMDYLNYKDKIIWLLTKEDILAIDDNGAIVKVFKNIEQATKYFKGNSKTKSIINKIINKVDRTAYGYRYANKYHYINMLKEDIMYYHREYNNEGGLGKVPVDMYHMEKGYIKSFNSLTEAANYMGCTKETIRLSVKLERKILGTEYFFKRSKEI